MYELGMIDKLSKSFRLSKEESHRIEMTKKAVKFVGGEEKAAKKSSANFNAPITYTYSESEAAKTTSAKSESSKNTMPQTGETSSNVAAVAGIGALAAAMGLGFAELKRRH